MATQYQIEIDARAALEVLPPRLQGAVLPLPKHDPHPALTLALHNLWSSLRLFVGTSSAGEPMFVHTGGAKLTPADAFAVFGPALVSRIQYSLFIY